MKIKFDSSQEYQRIAVQSVVDIFDGQPLNKGVFEVSFSMEGASLAFTEKGIGNKLVISEQQLLLNIQKIQEQNKLKVSEEIEQCTYTKDEVAGEKSSLPLDITIEMETGTGKTYTFIRTIYELNKVYGFKKFVIVVPSVAIREGAIKNLQITHDHFQELYGAPPINYTMYDRGRLTALRNFAVSDAIQILVINIDSFAKDTNVINMVRETGVKPIEYIQASNPIVIVDEPQNMDTNLRKAALHNLNPLCLLRYSATHREVYNMVYSLNPVQAYDLGLVKQIEVDGITSSDNYNAAFISLESIQLGKKNLKAKLTIYVNEKGGVKPKTVTVGLGDDLFLVSGERDMYKDGFILNEIRASDGEIEFGNGTIIREGESQGGLTDEVMKFQIERTIKHHFDKMKKLHPKGIKVLSLFFIDKVANYREYDTDELAVKGKFAMWFEELYEQISKLPAYKGVTTFTGQEVHDGYFSKDKKGKEKDTKGTTEDDNDTYNKIMRDKERLLNLDEPLQFIFSHSALREGWDNPNVFQICTLNESKSDMKKRQEIGRGLRLPVDSTGQRVSDKHINVLTVVANESYEDFSEALQREIQDDTNVDFTGRTRDARAKGQIKRTKELTQENAPLFFEIWEKIRHKTMYSVEFSTSELVKRAVEELKDKNRVPPVKRALLESRKVHLSMTDEGIEAKLTETKTKIAEPTRYIIPDVYGYIQSRVDISRSTIFQVIKQSARISELEINPQQYLDNVIAVFRRVLNSLMVDGIKYRLINGKIYEMGLFDAEEIETYLANLFAVTDTDKTIYNYVPVDSEVERKFAEACETDESIKFFFKLPRGFMIPTPLGGYRPDWAVIFENDKRIYFVAETKGTLDRQLLRDVEQMKIACGEQHFAILKPFGVTYKLITSVKDFHG